MYHVNVQCVDPSSELVVPVESDHGRCTLRSYSAVTGDSGIPPSDVIALRRRSAFRGAMLVPVVPSAYVAVIFPAFKRDVPIGEATSKVAAFLVQRFNEHTNVATALQTSLVQYTLYNAPQTGTAVLIIDASKLGNEVHDVLDHNNALLSLIDVINEAPAPFDPSRSSQFAWAVACDPRQEGLSAVEEEEWYRLPCCLSCLDRLEQLLSGLGGTAICRCPRDKCCCFPADTGCPVCHTMRSRTAQCQDCDATEDVWVCLICGHVGCSRYRAEHAKVHGEAAGHSFALSMLDQRIWDYEADRLAHRLVVSYVDQGVSELFEIPERGTFGSDEPCGASEAWDCVSPPKKLMPAAKHLVDAKIEEKVEELCADFSRHVARELEAQRTHLRSLLGLPASDSSASHCNTATTQPGLPLMSMDVSRDAALWCAATRKARVIDAELQLVRQTLREREQEERHLQSEQQRLSDALSSEFQAARERRRRCDELRQMIAEAQLNLEARSRVAAHGLNSADQASSFLALARRGPRRSGRP